MLKNISVYAIADKYNIYTLKELAKTKFETLAGSIWPHHDFPAIVKAAYESTSDNDQGLRSIVRTVCADHIGDLLQLEGPSAAEMMDIGQLGFDILRLAKKNSDNEYEQIASANAIMAVELRTKSEETTAMEQDRDWWKTRLESWIPTIGGIVKNARRIQNCRHCLMQNAGAGSLVFERVDHPTELRAILRCSICRTKHSLDTIDNPRSSLIFGPLG